MITVYYTKVFPFLEEDTFLSHLEKIEEERRRKILNMENKEGRRRSLTAGSLLHLALCKAIGILPEQRGPFSVEYGRNGKPYLTEYPDIHFNLSHSGEYVCCAVGDEPVGIDIQKAVKAREGLARRFFTAEDNRRLAECSEEEREKLFFRMWSIKESYIKLTGKGLGGGLDTFEIDWEENRIFEKGSTAAYFKELCPLPGYSLCVSVSKSFAAGEVPPCKEVLL